MDDSVKRACADLMFTDAVETLARRTGTTPDEARTQLIDSGLYVALYDLETDLWKEGPDYLLSYHEDLLH